MNKFYRFAVFLLAIVSLLPHKSLGWDSLEFVRAHKPFQRIGVKGFAEYCKAHPIATWKLVSAGIVGAVAAGGIMHYMTKEGRRDSDAEIAPTQESEVIPGLADLRKKERSTRKLLACVFFPPILVATTYMSFLTLDRIFYDDSVKKDIIKEPRNMIIRDMVAREALDYQKRSILFKI